MYLPENTALHGLGKSRFKKLAKKVGKVVKKLAPVIVPVVGGAVGTKLYAAYAARRKAAGASDAQIEAETQSMQARGISPEQALQQRPMLSPTPGAPDVSAPVRETAEREVSAPAGMPGWLLPAGIAAAVALFALK